MGLVKMGPGLGHVTTSLGGWASGWVGAGGIWIKTKLSPSWVKLSWPAWDELGKNDI